MIGHVEDGFLHDLFVVLCTSPALQDDEALGADDVEVAHAATGLADNVLFDPVGEVIHDGGEVPASGRVRLIACWCHASPPYDRHAWI